MHDPFSKLLSWIRNAYNSSLIRASRNVNLLREVNYEWNVKWYSKMPVDHFNYRISDTFELKYLTNYTHFHCDGPLFFYTGNEGNIESFAENTGIMWDLAHLFRAAVVFAEHRYYGESLPYGRRSFADVERLGYLSDIQALADFAELITFIKNDQNELGFCPASTEIPVIAFGGSYGGMLAAWLRMKYPHIVDGAWASSAPLRDFYGGADRGQVSNITSTVYVSSGCDRKVFSGGFLAIEKLSSTEKGRKKLNQIFHAEPNHEMKSIDDFASLYSYLYSAIFYMAMTDYPYPADFIAPLPRFPVKYVCRYAKKAELIDEKLAEQLYNITNVFYNYTGQLTYNCFTDNCTEATVFDNQKEEIAWDWQCCTSLTVRNCDRGGDNDFFLNTCGDNNNDTIDESINYCEKMFESIGYSKDFYKKKDATIRYGMTYDFMSNTILSNGNLDPWSASGVHEDSPGIQNAIKNGVYLFHMSDAAHHLDLRAPNTCDPPSVTYERFQVVNILKCWVYKNCTELPKAYELPDNIGWQVPANCRFIHYGYPWGIDETKKSWYPASSPSFTVLAAISAMFMSHMIA